MLIVAAVVLILFFLIVVLTFRAGYRGALRRTPAPPPRPRPTPDCSLPAGTLPSDTDPDITLTGNESDSDIRGKTIELPAGVTLRPARSLTLVARGNLTINGRIPTALGWGDSITLVSINGTLRVGSTAFIGTRPFAFTGTPPAAASGLYALALGNPGMTAGFIKLVAPAVVIEGTVSAGPGTGGGAATATGTGSGPFGGFAVAAGGQGGFGGAILICAEESVDVIGLAELRGGDGGTVGSPQRPRRTATKVSRLGGEATTAAMWRSSEPVPARARVRFRSVDAFSPQVKGGDGGNGGMAIGLGGAGRTFVSLAFLVGRGGRGTANGGVSGRVGNGGVGGRGGTVTLANCEVSPGAVVTAGAGGVGGPANATGGPGAPAVALSGYEGGDGDAVGGDGGLIGELLPFNLIGGGSSAVVPPTVIGGSGGTATATAGTGGTGGALLFVGTGGTSGRADAQGGSNPNTQVTPAVVPGAPVRGGAAPGGLGGIGPTVTSPGAP